MTGIGAVPAAETDGLRCDDHDPDQSPATAEVPAVETLRPEMMRAFPVPVHTRTLFHRWHDRQRLPDGRVL